MEARDAIEAFAALAQETRLRVFRALIQAGPSGLPAGEIARLLETSPSTLSFHLAALERARLLRSWRRQRQIFYAAHVDGIRRLLTFLTEDCCGSRPELCGNLGSLLTPDPCSNDCLPTETVMNDKVYNVLFLCTGNSARSIMAECALRRFGIGRFNAYSAGSFPKGQVHPVTLKLLKNLNYSTDSLRSKDWAEFATPDSAPLDFVFTVCDKAASEACPVWPGQPMTAHWGVEDPAAAIGNEDALYKVFKRVYLELENRIKIFSSLRLDGLDRLGLKTKLDRIGTTHREVTAVD